MCFAQAFGSANFGVLRASSTLRMNYFNVPDDEPVITGGATTRSEFTDAFTDNTLPKGTPGKATLTFSVTGSASVMTLGNPIEATARAVLFFRLYNSSESTDGAFSQAWALNGAQTITIGEFSFIYGEPKWFFLHLDTSAGATAERNTPPGGTVRAAADYSHTALLSAITE